MAPQATKTKAQKAAAAASSSKGKKKKWSKGKVKDKAQNAVVLDKTIYDRIYKEVPTQVHFRLGPRRPDEGRWCPCTPGYQRSREGGSHQEDLHLEGPAHLHPCHRCRINQPSRTGSVQPCGQSPSVLFPCAHALSRF